ncbi:hypothetical protein CVT24_013294 [Panaeolus cyanescens]|uniref:F-box domain-containing protein n=1 Tax=Panaeolus cyanescens TaxID=181874 RepID=A0A409YMB3_9AGAR|nr:hypothetical protein CVT24_013294 [Panaeolus cyanescens]
MSQRASVFSKDPIFAPEILAEIIGHLADLFATDTNGQMAKMDEMKKLAVVSKTMCSIARTHIFATIRLPSGEILHNLANLLRSNPRIGAAVQSMSYYLCKDTLNNPDILPFFELKNVTFLYAIHSGFRTPNADSGPTTLCPTTLLDKYLNPSTGSPSLKVLVVDNLVNLNHKKFVLSQSLESLVLINCSFTHDNLSLLPANIDSKPNSQLKSLTLSFTNIPLALLRECSVLEELQIFTRGPTFICPEDTNINIGSQDSDSSPALPSLKRLESYSMTQLEDDEVIDNTPYDVQHPQFPFLMKHCPYLEQLSLTISGGGPSLAYPNHNQLKILNVEWTRLQSADRFLEEQIELLSSLQVPALEKISLSVAHISAYIRNSAQAKRFQRRFRAGAGDLGRVIGDRDYVRFPSLKSFSLRLKMTRHVQVRRGWIPLMISRDEMKRELDVFVKELGRGSLGFEFNNELIVEDDTMQ